MRQERSVQNWAEERPKWREIHTYRRYGEKAEVWIPIALQYNIGRNEHKSLTCISISLSMRIFFSSSVFAMLSNPPTPNFCSSFSAEKMLFTSGGRSESISGSITLTFWWEGSISLPVKFIVLTDAVLGSPDETDSVTCFRMSVDAFMTASNSCKLWLESET